MRKLAIFLILPLLVAGYVLTRPAQDVLQDTEISVARPVEAVKLPEPPKTPELVEGTNTWRVQNGRRPLVENPLLVASAQAKCQDMQTNNYWSHNRPDGTEPWQFFKNAGYIYARAGENLAKEYPTSELTVKGWKESPTHNENMLNPRFTEVGYAVCQGPIRNLVVQHLATPL